MANTFYWYDLETSGTSPKWDRIVQFAGLRTDQDLNVIGDEYCTYVRLPDDVLPNPEASLVTGISPQLTHREGIRETEALKEINRLFSVPGTCVAGYNSLRFDDEFMRYSLYRNLLDPYAREWQQGNSRWDLIDLVRATGGLRREGIEWPQDEEGLPVYKLEELTKANGIEHGQAHDAMSDVHATVALAKLIKTQQPRLFDYYFSIRHKKKARQLLEPYGAQMCVHVSGIYPRPRSGVAPVVSIARHPTNGNSIIVVDLAQDIDDLLTASADDIAARMYTPEDRPALRELRINRCPFIAPIEVLNEENQRRLNIDLGVAKERARKLKQPGVAEKIKRVYQQPSMAANSDPDAGLYDGFLQDEDRSRCADLHERLPRGQWQDLDYHDARLHTLAQRMKARSYPALLEPGEVNSWREFVSEKLDADGDWLNLKQFESRTRELLDEISAGHQPGGEDAAAHRAMVLTNLLEHAADLRQRYQILDHR